MRDICDVTKRVAGCDGDHLFAAISPRIINGGRIFKYLQEADFTGEMSLLWKNCQCLLNWKTIGILQCVDSKRKLNSKWRFLSSFFFPLNYRIFRQIFHMFYRRILSINILTYFYIMIHFHFFSHYLVILICIHMNIYIPIKFYWRFE